jgi:hypothetical protein
MTNILEVTISLDRIIGLSTIRRSKNFLVITKVITRK